jgi:predicted O-methyltransferase YrrM
MEKMHINRNRLSELIWEIIFDSTSVYSKSLRDELFSKSITLEELREQADYNTGSISTGAIWTLFSACTFLKPKMIAEVGTFIGKSTFSMACALDLVPRHKGIIWTCDFSNNVNLDFATQTQVRQFKKMSSTDMFTTMVNENTVCDLLVLDGRLQDQDYALLPAILHSETVILLDDFEGTEKGVANGSQLMKSLQKSHHLVYPPSRELLRRYGLQEACSIGMIIPRNLVIFTNQ